MKSTRMIARLGNQRCLLNLSQNVGALSLCEAPVQKSHRFSQARTLASLHVSANSLPTTAQAAAEQEKNVMISGFEDIAISKKPFHKKVLMKMMDHSALHPTRVALSLAENPSKRITYVELHQQTYGVASFLANKGVGHLDVCCNVLPNCIEYVPAYLGTMMWGGISMGADVNCTKEELANAFRSSQCKAVITNFSLLSKVFAATKECPSVKTIVCVRSSKDELLPEEVAAWEDVIQTHTVHFKKISADDPAFIQYQTGIPESRNGIVMSHKNISTMLKISTEYYSKYVYKRMLYGNKEGVYEPHSEHAILSMPFHHIFGFEHLNRILLEGTSGVIVTKSDPIQYLEAVQKYKPKVVSMLPSLATFLVENSAADNYDLESLEMVLIGGAPFAQKLMLDFLRKYKHVRFMAPFYGWPECGVSFMSSMKRRYGTATVLPTFQLKVVSKQTGVALPFDIQGELCLRSPTTMLGYMNNPESTSKVLDKQGWFHTGDIGVLDTAGQTTIVDHESLRNSA